MHPHSNGFDSDWDERSRLDDEALAAIMAQLRGPERPAMTAVDWCVLAYERVSKSVQVSIPDQKRAIEEDAAKHGTEVKRHRWDVGSRWDDDRPDYRLLHADIESRQYTHLWLFNADRLGGDDQEFVATVRKARQHGMIVRDTVHGEIDDMLASVLGLVSYLEISHNHYRVDNALVRKHLEGVKLGSVPVGYQPQCRLHPCRCGLHGKHVPDPVRAPLVEELFTRYADGESLTVLQQWWNGTTGERRDFSSLRGILRDPYYVGIIVNRKRRNGRVEGKGKRKQEEWKVGIHDHPLNIEIATFAKVQARLQSQENVGQHRQKRPSDPMVGLVHCIGCERRMSTRKCGPGDRSFLWECPICHGGRSVRRITAAVHCLLAAIPFPDDHAVQSQANQQARLQQALRRELAAIDAERDKINRRISVWEDDRADGTMTKERYRERLAEAQQQLDELRQQQSALQDSHIAQPGRAALLEEVQEALATMGNWTSALEAMNPDTLRGVYRSLVKAINIDLAAGLMTVEYTEALARWCGRASDTVPLPSQKARTQ